ncbi:MULTISPECIES: DUF992 domain-containing protein [Neorhizobium]|jgi:hypothetical protein|uniref:DUF992 domain-containing protein n=3 Tax=Neorhizobium galegae TaxID=399 RepID=A0A068SY53_NEOGA|nr:MULTISPECIES: DUF992 domain-containing protein [Neorhizobium]KAB1083321.1 DUF992 domain-containing protein [Neorhizobium galegae]MCJ9673347.1 DUF992 domain-containing protein [Neorhizobium sp. SHOUNA12B]MCJ9745764.1 DUF992 domain-containing protein [Neorhizobium sp. SHOUNA12A]MCQ1851541.1 DUF992 domain-containing protein [Neorhizobium galegae]CDN50751.1 Conserved hypothetical protein [Neorhizobium galegae bv. orientalis str. HAMBI 540]
MKKIVAVALAALPVVTSAGAAFSADLITRRDRVPVYEEPDQRGGVRIGYLDCSIGGGVGYVLGSAKEADCVFTTAIGSEPLDRYTGTVRKMGVDLGFTTRSRLIWAVFAPTAGYHHGSLGGLYQGATAEATVGAGIGANLLVGGTAGSIHLQTVSVTGQLGLNVAATGTSVTLTPAG